MNGGSDHYKPYHFLKKCDENFQMHMCKLDCKTENKEFFYSLTWLFIKKIELMSNTGLEKFLKAIIMKN